jgi:hypothetical protein
MGEMASVIRCLSVLFAALWLIAGAIEYQAAHSSGPVHDDLDGDDLADTLEQALAERFAPIVLHEADEPNLPIDALSYVANSELWYFDESCSPKSRRVASPAAMIPALHVRSCGTSGQQVSSFGTFSVEKKHTFYLLPVDRKLFSGTHDSRRWVTYFHAYPGRNGMIIQYWRLFAYNTSYLYGMRALVGNHQGDWEAIHITLGPAPAYEPQSVRLLGHTSIQTLQWSLVVKQGAHPLIRSLKGGHTSVLGAAGDLGSARFIAQETWNGGSVRWPASRSQPARVTPGGPLLNLGEKTTPMKGMEFLRYSGLWGQRSTGWFGKYDSGYWGPAYNETGRQPDGFVAAWCEGIVDPAKRVQGIRECYPAELVP